MKNAVDTAGYLPVIPSAPQGRPSRFALLPCVLVRMIFSTLLLFPVAILAQDGDTPQAGDSVATTIPDSGLAVIDTTESNLDAPIYYFARTIDNHVQDRMSYLIGEAVVKFKGMTIEAGKITVDMNSRTLVAEALPETLAVHGDSLLADGTAANAKIEQTGSPVFTDGGDRLVGERMEYNFSTGKGLVVRGRTEFEGGKYYGKQMKRVAENVMNVSSGIYTSCDLETEPHYHFWARRMKLIVNERVIAKPIVLYLGKIPLAILPFGMFPTQSGRRSGLIVPRYGESASEGRYLCDLGYYWAISDYMDARATIDYFDRSGWLLKAGMNYALRYNFTGGISGSLTRKNFVSGAKQRRWDLSVRHKQELSKTASLRVSGLFVSDNSYYKDLSFNSDQRLTRRLRSQATFSKNWPKAKNNLTVSLQQEKDLQDGSETRDLPQISFYFGERQLFGKSNASLQRGQSRGSAQTGSTEKQSKWYENIFFRYNASGQSRFTHTPATRSVTVDSSFFRLQIVGSDSQLVRVDTTVTRSEATFTDDRRSYANHDLALRMSTPGRLFGWLSLSQNLTFAEDWFDRENIYADSTLVLREQKGFYARHTFGYSASANTKIYGYFQPHIGPIKAFRHVMSPSISFNYRPDFSKPFWGYYREVRNAAGTVVLRDRFSGTPLGKLASLSMSLSNLLQMKAMSGDKEKKFDLFNLNFSSSYNFAAAQKKLSNLATSINARPTSQISLSFSSTHSPYVFERTGSNTGQEINRYLFVEHGIWSGNWLRLTSLTTTMTLTIQGKTSGAAAGNPPGSPSTLPTGDEFDNNLATGFDRFEAQHDYTDFGIPWKANLSLSYSLSRFNPLAPTKTIYANISNAEVSLSQNWRVNFTGQVDLRAKQMVSQYWSIYRNLHCWEASFTWTPIGPGKGFYLRINVKAPQLRDLKYEHRGGRASIFGGSYY